MSKDKLTLEEHQEIFANIRKIMQQCFAQQGSFMPMIHAIHPDKAMSVIAVASDINSATDEGRETKDRLEQMMIKLADEGIEGREITALCFGAEAWTLSPEDLEQIWDKKTGHISMPIAAHPRRIEILSVMYATPEWNLMASAPIIRNDDPWGVEFEKARLGDWEIYPVVGLKDGKKLSATGRFANYWDKSARKNAYRLN